jgi:hypothetical protein
MVGKVMGTSLAAVMAIGMIATATAEALPEWQKEKEALTESLPFKIGGGAGKFETPGGAMNVTWTSVVGKGQIEGVNAIAKLSLGFWGSKAKESGKECEVNSPKAKKGEVITKELKGSIGYLDKATKKVGALFEPVVAKAPFAEVEGACLKGKLLLFGSVIGKVTSPLNSELGTVQLTFNIVAKGQEFVKFEGSKEEHKLTFGEFGETALFDCKEENLELEKGNKVEIKA